MKHPKNLINKRINFQDLIIFNYSFKLFLIVFLLYFSNLGIAQNGFVNTPTVTSSSLGKAAATPVNYNNGTANTAIPLYTISDFDLNVPVSLSYQTGGIRVSDVASSVGLGWSLNAGGVVTRVVRGLPDETNERNTTLYSTCFSKEHHGYFKTLGDIEYCNSSYCVNDIEPDIFYYNINGVGGKFFLDKQLNVIQVNKTDIKIKYSVNEYAFTDYCTTIYGEIVNLKFDVISSFTFTLPDGTVYKLGSDILKENKEFILDSDDNELNAPYVNSWFLSEVTSPKQHKTTFTYEEENYQIWSLGAMTVKARALSNTEYNVTYDPIDSLDNTQIVSKRIKSIESPFSKLIFNYEAVAREDLYHLQNFTFFNEDIYEYKPPKRLNSVEIQQKRNGIFSCIKNYELDQSYIQSTEAGLNDSDGNSWISGLSPGDYPDMKRNKLDAIIEKSCDENLSYTTSFEYYNTEDVPRRLSHSQDYWGFNNGHDENKSLVPRVQFQGACNYPKLNLSENTTFPWANDRNAEFEPMQSGSIKKIIYPTGQFTEFIYEANTINTIKYGDETEIGKNGKIYQYNGPYSTQVFVGPPNDPDIYDIDFDCGVDPFITQTTSTEIKKIYVPIDEELKLIMNMDHIYCEATYDVVNFFYEGYRINVFQKPSGATNYSTNPTHLYTISSGVKTKKVIRYKNGLEQDLDMLEGGTYDLLFVFEPLTSGGDFNPPSPNVDINFYKTSLINQDVEVGGLRIKQINTNQGVRKYDYMESVDRMINNGSLDFGLNVCKKCPENQNDAPGGPNDPPIVCHVFDEYTAFVNCKSKVNLDLEILDYGCNSSGIIRVSWKDVNNSSNSGEILKPFSFFGSGVYSPTYNLNNEGLDPGFEYKFKLEILQNGVQYPPVRSNAKFSIIAPFNNPPIDEDFVSSGKLVNVPTMIGVQKLDPYQRHYFNDNCIDDKYIYTINSFPVSHLDAINGNHIVYGSVTESYGDPIYGSTKMTYNIDSDPLNNVIENMLMPLLPISPYFPSSPNVNLDPLFGSLQKTEILDMDENVISETTYDYIEDSDNYNFKRYGNIEVCDPNGDDYWTSRYTNYKLKSFLVLPKSIKTTTEMGNYQSGITTVKEFEYRADFEHLNPISINFHDEQFAGVLNKLTTIKYAHELGRQDLIDRNIVSVPLETLTDGGEGGGQKVDIIINNNNQILTNKKYSALNDGSWILMGEVVAFNTDGSATETNSRGDYFNKEFIWDDGLLTNIKFGARETIFEYDDNYRRLSKKTGSDDVYSEYLQYDALHRLIQKSDNNGTVLEDYEYTISTTENEQIKTTLSFPNDIYNLENIDKFKIVDIDNRSGMEAVFNTLAPFGLQKKKFTDALGRVTKSRTTGAGSGYTEYKYASSPLNRPIEIIPNQSTKKITIDYSVATPEEAGVLELGYVGKLYKKSVTDENGNTTTTYTDIFGRKQSVKDANEEKTRYVYNKRNQLTKVIPPATDHEETLKTYNYTYDPVDGKLINKFIPDKGTFIYEYDDNTDQLKKTTYPNGSYRELIYHSQYNDVLVEEKVNGSSVKQYIISDFATNRLSEVKTLANMDNGDIWLSTLTDQSGDFDDLGRVLHEVVQYPNNSNSEYTYVYDALDNIRESKRIHTYNGQPIEISKTYEYGERNRLTGTNAKFPQFDNIPLNKLEYNFRDWMTQKTIGDIQTIDYGYTPRGWLKSINSVAATYPEVPEPCDDEKEIDCEEVEKVEGRLMYNNDKLQNNIPTTVSLIMNLGIHQGDDVFPIQSTSLKIGLNGGSTTDLIDSTDLYHFSLNIWDNPTTVAEGLVSIIKNQLNPQGIDANQDELEQLAMLISEELTGFGVGDSGDSGGGAGADHGGALFGMELFYTEGNSDLNAAPRFNGDVSWMKWRVNDEIMSQYGFTYDKLNRLTYAKYKGEDLLDCEDIPDGAYDVSISYDERGNVMTLMRDGVLNMTEDEITYGQIDNLTYSNDPSSANQLQSVTDAANPEKGFKSNTSYLYEFGNITTDGASAQVITYNYMDLPTEVSAPDGSNIKMYYDADGVKLKQIVTPSEGSIYTIEYHGGIEYKNGELSSILHEEGRVVYGGYLNVGEQSVPMDYIEYQLTDHLGNVRVRFTDTNGDGVITSDKDSPADEILGSYHYYPFGMKMEGRWHQQQGTDNRYQYNGIETCDDTDLLLNFATYRTLDPSIVRWLQIDPEAESYYNLNPYNSMGNSPVVNNDPNGDSFLAAAIIGAAVSVIGNGVGNVMNDQKFFAGAGQAALFGAISGIISTGIGHVVQGIQEGSQFGVAAFQAILHGWSGEALNLAQGGTFGSGFLSGSMSSGMSSAAKSLGMGTVGMIGVGGLSGGVGSMIGGGDFWTGSTQGLITSALNHGLHKGVEALHRGPTHEPGDPIMEALMNNSQNNYKGDLYGSILSGGSFMTGYASASLKFGKAIGIQTNFRSFKVYELYRANRALNGNQYISGSKYIRYTKIASKVGVVGTIASSFFDIYQGAHIGNNGYYYRGFFSGVANTIPYAGPFLSYWISSQPANNFRMSDKTMRRNWVQTCFVAGTEVLLSGGKVKKIEQIEKGDKILSVNIKTFEVEEDIVVSIPIKVVKYRLIKMELMDGRIVEFSPGHPFWTVGKGWAAYDVDKALEELDLKNVNIKVSQLDRTDKMLVYENGILKEIGINKIVDSGKQVEMYNVEHVLKNHTFFANGILVHNRN